MLGIMHSELLKDLKEKWDKVKKEMVRELNGRLGLAILLCNEEINYDNIDMFVDRSHS